MLRRGRGPVLEASSLAAGSAPACPSLSPVGRNRWSNPARLRFNQAKLGKQEPAAPSGEPGTWGPAQGPQDKGHQGPGLWPCPQRGTAAPTDSVTEGSAGSTWHWGWLGSRERAVPCLVPAAALPVLGSTGAAAGTGKGVRRARRGTAPLGDMAPCHVLGCTPWCPPRDRASRSCACQPCSSGWGGIRGSSWEQRSYGRNGATLTLPAPNRKQAPSPASTSAPDLLAGASGTARDGSGWGCGRRCVPPG